MGIEEKDRVLLRMTNLSKLHPDYSKFFSSGFNKLRAMRHRRKEKDSSDLDSSDFSDFGEPTGFGDIGNLFAGYMGSKSPLKRMSTMRINSRVSFSKEKAREVEIDDYGDLTSGMVLQPGIYIVAEG